MRVAVGICGRKSMGESSGWMTGGSETVWWGETLDGGVSRVEWRKSYSISTAVIAVKKDKSHSPVKNIIVFLRFL